MSGFLSKIVVKSITKVIKSTSKFDIAIDDIIDKFKDSCPPKKELLRIIKQKNQISNSLSQVLTILNTLNTTTNSAKNLITTLDITVKIIKSIPVPTAVAGVGIPIKVITILADTLDVLSNVIAAGKGAIDIVPPAYKQISSSANDIISKLNQLDLVLNPCINDIMQDLNEEEKELFLEEIDNNVLEVGQFSSNDENLLDNNVLLERLQPTSTNPLYHKSFKLTLEIDTNNPFSIPSRRIKGLKEPNEILYNTFDGSYSYTSNPTILINEIKFVIDTTTDYPLIDLTVQSNGIENFPFGDEGGPLEIRKVYEVIEQYQEIYHNLYRSVGNAPYGDITKYFVKIRDYKYDTFTKSWDIINVETLYSESDPTLTEIINSSDSEWGELINNVGGTIITSPSLYPFNREGKFQSQIAKTFTIPEGWSGNGRINFTIKVYSWSDDKNKWDFQENLVYYNQTSTQYQELITNDPLVIGENRFVAYGSVTILPNQTNDFPPFNVQGEEGEIRMYNPSMSLFIFQDNNWVPYNYTFPPFGLPGLAISTSTTYQLLNTVTNSRLELDLVNESETMVSFPISHEVRMRVFTWDNTSFIWNNTNDYNITLTPSDYAYYQGIYINWDTL